MNVKKEIETYIGRQIEDIPNNIELYKQWYSGFVPNFHRYKIYDGTKSKQIERFSLKMAKSCGETWANLLINEKTYVTLENEKDQLAINDLYNKLNYFTKNNNAIEIAYSLGDGIGIVGLKGLVTNESGEVISKDNVEITYEFIDASRVYPITWRYGELKEVGFVSFGTLEADIVLHLLDENKTYKIVDLKYARKDINDEFELISTQVFNTFSKAPLFGYLKPNIVNNIDMNSQRGISIYANAIDCLKSIDLNYDCYNTELQLYRSRAWYSGNLNNVDSNGNVVDVFDPNDFLIYKLPSNNDGTPNIKIEQGQLRVEAYSKSLNDALSIFGYKVGLGKDYYSFSAGLGSPIQTATGIIAQNMELYRSMMKNEIVVRKFLQDTTYAIMYMSNKFANGTFTINSPNDIKILFDDSIFEDKESTKESDRKDVNLAIMSEVEYRVDNYGESEEVALSFLQKNPAYIAKCINLLLPALKNKVITPKEFVLKVYNKEDSELIKTIEESLQNSSIDELQESLFNLA